MPKRVLIVAGNLIERRGLAELIKRFGHGVATLETGSEAIAALKADGSGETSLLVLDLTSPAGGGMEVLTALRSLPRRYPAIVQIAEGDIEAAMAAMAAGAVDFVVKPVSPERLEVSIKNALRIEALEVEIGRMQGSARSVLGRADLAALSEGMVRVVELVHRAAQSAITVLIEGESGVGKALLARIIHGESARAGNPFAAVNCSAIQGTDIEDCLFGHSLGAPGKFIEAAGGTIFLNEIEDLPLQAQARLLRILNSGEIERPGSAPALRVDTRLIVSTSHNLIDRVREGRFREDLYYRLTVFPIWVPPLRHRLDDLGELVRQFIVRFAAEETKRVDGIAPEALAMLKRYGWPGNIRQLENAVFRAVALADGPLLGVNEFPQVAAHVQGYRVTVPPAPAPRASIPRIEGPVMLGTAAPTTIRIPSANGRDGVGIPALSQEGDIRSLEAVEADMIRLAFGRYRGRMTEIARRLGIGRSTLYRKMREIGLEPRPN
jgi:DNA-binding NtrC family response regulator